MTLAKTLALFEAALEQAPEQRAAFVDGLVNTEAGHIEAVRDLLDAHAASNNFLEPQTMPTVLAPYRLLESLGAGGMGQVWLAERADGVFEQRVAIKVMASYLGDAQALARATAERQFLATLEHPNITRVLDGGTTSAGQPYVVMEYVDGMPIDRYCRANVLTPRQRIVLFIQVLEAVDAAHRALIVHRDLKPSNVMVNLQGQVKLVDFGIAKALSAHGDSAATLHGLGPMTLDYASPEQFEGRALTTACDVWALGVLLFELLTGKLPFELHSASLVQISQIHRHGPRLRASNAAQAEALGVEERDARSWRKLIGGDMDRVLAKSLSYEPGRRYASARAFADDLQRWLAHEPVQARAGGIGYRAMKFARRHRLPVAAGIVALTVLIVGWAATARQAAIAEREKENARNVGEVMAHMLSNANPSVGGGSGGLVTIASVVQRMGAQLKAGGFDSRPEVKVELARIISENLTWQGRYSEASEFTKLRIATIRSALQENSTLQLLADADQACVDFNEQRLAASNAGFERAVPKLRRAYRDRAITPRSLAKALNYWGYLRRTQGDSVQAEQHFREALALADALAPEDFFQVATTRSVLASTLADQGKFSEALRTAEQAVHDFTVDPERKKLPDYGFALTVHAGFLLDAGERIPAQLELLEAEDLFRNTLGALHLWLGDNLRNQALLWLANDDLDRAERSASEALQIYERSFGEKYDHYPTVLMIQAEIAAARGNNNVAEALFRQALRLRKANMPSGHYFVALSQSALGAWLARRDPTSAEAKALLQTSYQSLLISQGADNPRTRLAKQRVNSIAL